MESFQLIAAICRRCQGLVEDVEAPLPLPGKRRFESMFPRTRATHFGLTLFWTYSLLVTGGELVVSRETKLRGAAGASGKW